MKETMKAYVLEGPGRLCFKDVPVPEPRPDEVLIKVMAAGICGSDIPRICRTGAHRHPLIPGHEFAGIVERTGSEVSEHWIGKRVGVFPLKPCFSCSCCREGQYELCREYDYLGSRCDGGFGEYTAVPEWNLIELPDMVSFEQAAMLEPMAVAVHNIRRIGLKKEETALILGLGTIGLCHLLFLMEAGQEQILAVGNRALQKRLAKEAGLPEEAYMDSKQRDIISWVMEQTGGAGADASFECVGRPQTAVAAVDSLGAGGRAALVGNPSSDILFPAEVYGQLLRKQLTVKGSWNSSFCHHREDDWHYVLERVSQNRVAPQRLITHRLPFEELEKGICIMRDKTEEYVKIMLMGNE